MSFLLLRADAGPRVGTGHVMRCIALAQAWQDRGGRVGIVNSAEARSLEPRLAAERLEIFPSAGLPGSPEDAARTVELARTAGASWVVTDGYALGSGYARMLKAAGLRVASIDDHGCAGDYAADVIVDVNLAVREDLYVRRPPSSRLLAGIRYALLRREFRALKREAVAPPPSAGKLLVTLGGSDPGNVTLRVIAALPDPAPETVVVVGPANPHRASLEEAARAARGRIRLEDNVTRMPELMAWADAAVSAAGGTAWELAFLGVPTLLLIAAENQRPNVAPLVDAGAAISGESDLPGSLARLISDAPLRTALSAKARTLVDGKGADRVAAVLEAGLLRFRRAGGGDAKLLWEWTNDPNVRSVSFSSAPVPWEAHVAWLERKLADPLCVLYVVTNETGAPVGQVRYDGAGPEAVVSVSLAVEFRGRGWGAEILRRATAAYFEASAAAVVRAYVKPGNEASERVFRDAGFAGAAKGAPGRPEASHWFLERERSR